MRTLTPTERRTFRAKAHHLHPFVSIGQHSLTPAVLHEIDVNLLAHELIKIRVFSDDRGEREALLARICSELDAAPVQHLGKILTIWRPVPEPEAPVAAPGVKPDAGSGKRARAKPREKAVGGASKRRSAKPREKAADGASKRRSADPREKAADGASKRRSADPRDKASAGASKRRPARPRSDEPRKHYRAAPVAPDGNTPGNSPAATRPRRRKIEPRGDAVAQVGHPPRTRRRTSR